MKEKDKWEGLIRESRRRDAEWAGFGVKWAVRVVKEKRLFKVPCHA